MKFIFITQLRKLRSFIEKGYLNIWKVINKAFIFWEYKAPYYYIYQIIAIPWHRHFGDLKGSTKLITSTPVATSYLASSHQVCFKILYELHYFYIQHPIPQTLLKKIFLLLQSHFEILWHGENVAFLPSKRFTMKISSKEENYIISLQRWALVHKSLIEKLG